MEKKNIIIYFIIAVIFFSVGFMLSLGINKYTSGKQIDSSNTYQAGWEAARERLYKTGYLQLPDWQTPIKEILGNINNVSNSKITIITEPLDPLADPDLNNRIVEINSNTKIFHYAKKSKEQYDKELEEFNSKYKEKDWMNKPDSDILPPSNYYLAETVKDDLQTGQQIRVKASQDIKNEKQFIAEEITILPTD